MTEKKDNTDMNEVVKIETPHFKYNPETSKNVNKTLSANAACTVSGQFTARQAGGKKLAATLTYAENNKPVRSETRVTTIEKRDLLTGEGRLILVTDEGHTLIGNESSKPNGVRGFKDGPFINSRDCSMARNPFINQIVFVGTDGMITVFNNDGAVTRFSKSHYALFDVQWNDDLNHYIAVGKHGTVLISEDGYDWVQQSSGTEAALLSISWSSTLQRYVVVGTHGTIIVSTEGKNWKVISNKVTDHLINVVRSDELEKYVIMREQKEKDKDKFGGLITSSDGIDWKYYPNALPGGTIWRSMAWSPLRKRFVIVGDQRSIANSYNSEFNWKATRLPQRPLLATDFRAPSFDLRKVIWSEVFEIYITVGTNFAGFYSSTGEVDESTKWFDLTEYVSTIGWIFASTTFIAIQDTILPE